MLALERQLGQELFHRRARGYSLTEQGTSLLERVSTMDSVVRSIEPVDAEKALPRVKISAGAWMTYLLCTHANRLRANDPLVLQLVASDLVLDIEHREVVIGIRNARPEEHYLACRRTADIRFAVFAHRDSMHEADNSWVSVLADTPSARWARSRAAGRTAIEVSSPRNALDCVLAGGHEAVLPLFVGYANSELVRISEPIVELEHQQWLVMHHDDRHLPEVRVVIERLVELLRTELPCCE